MEILEKPMTIPELQTMAERIFGNLVKAVVDIEQNRIALDAELHADEEALLLQAGSRQENLWGINLYPEMERNGTDFVEFDSMINLKPSQNNRSRGVEDPIVREKIISVVNTWIA